MRGQEIMNDQEMAFLQKQAHEARSGQLSSVPSYIQDILVKLDVINHKLSLILKDKTPLEDDPQEA